jgi:hypothetical protein
MMAEIHTLPGVFRPELEPRVEVEAVLKCALEANYRDIVFVARRLDGELAVGTSIADMDAAIGLLMRGVTDLATSLQVEMPDDAGDDA